MRIDGRAGVIVCAGALDATGAGGAGVSGRAASERAGAMREA
jgi:hypothetical protein